MPRGMYVNYGKRTPFLPAGALPMDPAKNRQFADALRAQTYAALQEDYFRKKFNLPTERERIAEQQQVMMQEKAKLDAALMEKRYTEKQKREIEESKSRVSRIQQDPTFTPEQKAFAIRQEQLKQMGIRPEDRFRLSKDPKGREDGQMWEENGVMLFNDNGTKRQIDFRKTPKGLAQEQELDAIKEQKKLDIERMKAQEKFKDELTRMKVPDETSEAGERYLTATEMRELYDRRFPQGEMPTAAEVQHAREYVSMMIDRWGNTPPQGVAEAIKRAQAVIRASTERAW